MKIGVFDSGVGGLSVLESLLKARLFEHIIYYGDTARVPYGPKDPATIAKFSLEALDFFLPFNIDMLVVACNTVSAWALPAMRTHTKIPIVGVIEAG
ncbi:aspartate/glutamate racemase family protein, partial [Helicobacter heilmannii]